jgi:hypothetical protein
MNKQLRVQSPNEVSTDRRETLLATLTLNDELPNAIEFGIQLNRCFFYSSQHWIACTAVSCDRAANAWLDLRLQAQKLSAAPLAANAISRTVQAVEEEFARIMGLSWHLESRVDLLSKLRQLPDDEFFEGAEDILFAAYLSPVRAWKTSLLESITEHLSSMQVRAVLLGDSLGSYVMGDRVWKGMYLAESTKEPAPATLPNNGAARPVDPEIFEGDRVPLDEIFWVRTDLPNTVVDRWPLQLDDREIILLQQRFGELGLSWEVAKPVLFNLDNEDNNAHDDSRSELVTENSLARFIQTVRAGTRTSVSVGGEDNYLGIIVDDFTVFYRDDEAPLGRSRKLEKLAKEYVKAGEAGLSRRDLARLQREGTNPSLVDQENGKLNRELGKIGLSIDSDRVPGEEGRFVLRPIGVRPTS